MTTVFTNGCFDILHPGHVRLLRWAKEQGDRLVVGLNDDGSVARLKPGRPIMAVEDRAEMLAALRCVDEVRVFHEDTPERLIRDVNPDVLVKGEDWFGREIAGAEYVKSRGGLVLLAPLAVGYSTSSIIEKIRAR